MRRTRKPRTSGYLTRSEAAAYLHVSEPVLARMIRAGRFPPPIRHGGAGDAVWERRTVAAYAIVAPLLPELFRLPSRQKESSGGGK